MTEGRRFVVVAVLLATIVVVIANVIAARLEVPLNWITSIVSAVVVGGFLALLLFNKKHNADGGFQVDGVRERRR